MGPPLRGGSVVEGGRSSILLRQHDRDHALGDGRISRIGSVARDGLAEVIDLEKDPVAVDFE